MLNKKLKRIIAIIGLVFMAVFTVCLPVYFAKPNAWSGRVGQITLYCGLVGISFYFLIWLDNKQISRKQREEEFIKKQNEEFKKMQSENGDAISPNQISSVNANNLSEKTCVNPTHKSVSQVLDNKEKKGKNELGDNDLL